MAEEKKPTKEELKAQEDAQADFQKSMPAAGAPLLAARVGDPHICPMVTGVVPHVGGPILPPGAPTVLIGGLPAANVGTPATCTGPPDSIVKGSATVLIGGKPAARMLDSTAHGGVIVLGCPTVIIGG
jgi:uncharacterized Zn-binding protein involved in type VI secretion